MSNLAIQVEGLGKQYKLGAQQKHQDLRDQLAHLASAPLRAIRSLANGAGAAPPPSTFWALRNVGFDIEAGEVVGIIGRNGAGKSTLLKILARITEPTEGKVSIWGRVGSLLEVGSGFHVELSGRDNVYLNGAILGMRKSEIDQKFDEIVAFSEIEKFIDTPVKHYSSGMHMRLAFSVAAHLEPEVLLIDEVLAVGDAAFQKKCLGRMEDVAKEGRTVLFVSHNMAAVSQLTRRSILISEGRVGFVGATDEAIRRYLDEVEADTATFYVAGKHGRRLPGYSRDVEFVSFELREHSNKILPGNADLVVWITLKANRAVADFRLNNTILKSDGTPVGTTFGPETLSIGAGESLTIELRMKDLRLAPGHYQCSFGIGQGHPDFAFDIISDIVSFQVLSPDEETVAVWHPVWGSVRFESTSYKAICSDELGGVSLLPASTPAR